MKLIVDIGNTRQKIAVFDGKDAVKVDTFNGLDPSAVKSYIARHGPFGKCILSSVKNNIDEIVSILEEHCRVVVLDHFTKVPVLNRYATPETLGRDRLAAAVGAFSRFPGRNVLVVDAGTAITYEMVTAAGEYLGGGISPGIGLRFRALNTFTGKLPLVERREGSPLIGKNTEESILSGVMHGILKEVEGILSEYNHRYEDLVIAFTGGDLNYFVNNLKNNIFALPNLVLEGLNEILDIND